MATKTPGSVITNEPGYILGSVMKFAITILKRVGLVSAKAKAPDPFDLRLKRIGAREARVAAHAVLFIQPLQPQEA